MGMDRLRAVVEQAMGRLPAVRGRGEEATKQALVMPLLDALGYDIWNPAEVCPEYDADFAVRKAGQKEKVDIAIFFDGVPRIYLEVKDVDVALDGHAGQLARYFNATTSANLAVLTNGLEWRFYTDTGDANVMDASPFHIARLDAVDQGLDVLLHFARGVFTPEAIRDFATELLYTARLADFLRNELDLRERDPSDYFVRWALKSDSMYTGLVNAGVVERFSPIVKAALTRVLREVVRRSITAMEEQTAQSQQLKPGLDAEPGAEPDEAAPVGTCEEAAEDEGTTKRSIVTTATELELFAAVKTLWETAGLAQSTIFDLGQRRHVPTVLMYKDTTGYFGIYVNKPAWWALRLVCMSKGNWLGLNLPEEVAKALLPPGVELLPPHPWAPVRVAIDGPADVPSLGDAIMAALRALVEQHQQQS